jgi:tRNA (guanine-N7-)-methyltransferase
MKPFYISLRPFIPWKQLERPIEWDHIFGRPAPLEVEFGFGLGDFLVRQARIRPQTNFVGLELGWVQVRRALRKIAIARVRNVRVLRIDSKTALDRIFPEKSLRIAYTLFPCPWPKKKHAKHRLFSSAFLTLLNSRIVDGGEALIVTDSHPYAEWIRSQVSGTGFQVSQRKVAPRFSTKYERKWHASGLEKFYELKLIKRQHLKRLPKEDTNLIARRVKSFAPEHFRPSKSTGDITVRFKETLYDPKRKLGMVRSIVGEDKLLQDFWIEIVKKGHFWHIRPAKGCGIVPTAGIQRALDLVYDATNHDG